MMGDSGSTLIRRLVFCQSVLSLGPALGALLVHHLGLWGRKPYRQVSPPPRYLQHTHPTHSQDLCPFSPHTSPLPGVPTAT
jgi:hypothetical protein